MVFKNTKIKILSAVIFILAVCIPFAAVHPYFSSTGFCLSCHEMDLPYQEYKKSKHFNNPSGVRAECFSCHIPQPIGPMLVRKAGAVKELYSHFSGVLGAEEKFKDERARMAKGIWADMKANDSRECRYCHNQQAFVFAEFKKPKESERMQKGLQEKQTCIDCHKGRIHQMPDLSGGFKRLYKELETAAADPKISTPSVYPLTTVLCYDGKEGEREGRVLAATRLTVLNKDGSWLKVRAEGWQQDGVNAIIYELQGKRIFAVALDKQAREKPKIDGTMTDDATEQIWHKVSFETWVMTQNMVGRLETLWDYGSEMHGAVCGSCHSITPAGHFLANQWIGGLKDMKQFINLETEEYYLLQKYLQMHAQDVEGESH
jgi:trimethylamine-N-oxide reductase cytochrome c-type subunit TorC